jgi:hypothetical protein
MLWLTEEHRNGVIEKVKTTMNTNEYRKRASVIQKEVQNRPGMSERKSVFQKEYQNREDIRIQTSNTRKEYLLNNPDAVNNISSFQKDYQNREDVKRRVQERSIELWKDPVFANKMICAMHKYKEYVMPSGAVVKLQGYEPQVLTELLKTYSEDDIIIGIKEMNAEIGRIQYTFNGTQHTYYPDFYIKSTNTIVEVKSKYTFEIHKEKNLAKEHACLQQGFNFVFKII